MRVTSRRMRAALSSFRSAVPKEVSRHWSEELGWVASQLGRARDLDVFIAEGLASVSSIRITIASPCRSSSSFRITIDALRPLGSAMPHAEAQSDPA